MSDTSATENAPTTPTRKLMDELCKSKDSAYWRTLEDVVDRLSHEELVAIMIKRNSTLADQPTHDAGKQSTIEKLTDQFVSESVEKRLPWKPIFKMYREAYMLYMPTATTHTGTNGAAVECDGIFEDVNARDVLRDLVRVGGLLTPMEAVQEMYLAFGNTKAINFYRCVMKRARTDLQKIQWHNFFFAEDVAKNHDKNFLEQNGHILEVLQYPLFPLETESNSPFTTANRQLLAEAAKHYESMRSSGLDPRGGGPNSRSKPFAASFRCSIFKTPVDPQGGEYWARIVTNPHTGEQFSDLSEVQDHAVLTNGQIEGLRREVTHLQGELRRLSGRDDNNGGRGSGGRGGGRPYRRRGQNTAQETGGNYNAPPPNNAQQGQQQLGQQQGQRFH